MKSADFSEILLIALRGLGITATLWALNYGLEALQAHDGTTAIFWAVGAICFNMIIDDCHDAVWTLLVERPDKE